MPDTRPGPGVPLHQLRVDPELIPHHSTLNESQRHGWSCVFCRDYTGGAAPVAGAVKLGVRGLVACFTCYRQHGTVAA